ncbi:39S ribosomal protein L46, mitochondrial [Agrilus planipennis]|uniref:Large ribosomal subunit protein mL46 n=1 Tax=Agrilus planipennis TaxID=224129 RepID=A0A1W4X7D9_AGRPL|nr:39S ribosomal protein L46, mitochondrial [Agrilus planipennis]
MIRTYAFLAKTSSQILNSASYSSVQVAQKWDLFAAVCLERCPIITPPLSDIEVKVKKMFADIELERSYKNDWELRHEQEQNISQQLKKGEEVEVSTLQTVQDFIDAATEARSKFKEADRLTEADKANDVTSLSRKLDKHLVLLVQHNLNNKNYYLLPQGKRKEGETLRQTAERILKESCGTEIRAQFFGNAPAGFYKYKYPNEIRSKTGSVGAKIFIYAAHHKDGQVNKKDSKFKWLDRHELEKELPDNYHKSVSAFLIDE